MFKQFFQINFYVLAKNMYGVGGGVDSNQFLFDNLCVLTQSQWFEGLIAWPFNFQQMHLVIKDNHSFQSLLGFQDLNLILNLHLIWLKI